MRVTAAVQAFLADAGMPYDVEEDGGVLRLSFADADTDLEWTCVAFCVEAEGLLVFFSVAPDDVTPDLRPAVAEYLVRANRGLRIGCLEMDWADGEVRLRTSVAAGRVPLAPDLIRPVVAGNLQLMRRYLPGLVRVVAGASPEQAVAAAEARELAPLPI